MKVITEYSKPVFTPMTLAIIIETQEDMDTMQNVLATAFGYAHTIESGVEDSNRMRACIAKISSALSMFVTRHQ
jgi:hypothetical protein